MFANATPLFVQQVSDSLPTFGESFVKFVQPFNMQYVSIKYGKTQFENYKSQNLKIQLLQWCTDLVENFGLIDTTLQSMMNAKPTEGYDVKTFEFPSQKKEGKGG